MLLFIPMEMERCRRSQKASMEGGEKLVMYSAQDYAVPRRTLQRSRRRTAHYHAGHYNAVGAGLRSRRRTTQ
jgi:hypothetical protein